MAHGTPHSKNIQKFKGCKIGTFNRTSLKTRLLVGQECHDRVSGFRKALFWGMVCRRIQMAPDKINQACNKLIDVGREIGKRL
jgi:hypothetical protein